MARCIVWRAPARRYVRFLNPSSRHFSVSFSFHSLSRPCSLPHAIPARRFSSSSLGPLAKYQELVSAHTLIDDPGQAKVAQLLQNLYEKLLAGNSAPYTPTRPRLPTEEAPQSSSWFGWLSSKKAPQSKQQEEVSHVAKIPGLYIYGGVGTGKTMLVDMFLSCLPPSMKKRRTHFHAFMLDVHARIFKLSKTANYQGDPLPEVAKEMAKEASVLAFDEFQVNDIADAMIMKRLFSELFAQGCVVIATSNRAPSELYRNGINRHLFLPFIDLLTASTTVHHIVTNPHPPKSHSAHNPVTPTAHPTAAPISTSPHVSTPSPSPSGSIPSSSLHTPALDGGTDYRRVKGAEKLVDWAYFAPINADTSRRLDEEYDYLLSGKRIPSHSPTHSKLHANEEEWNLDVRGRMMKVRGNRERRVARFTFHDLCARELGAADYIAIAQAVDTVVLTNIPVLRTDHAHCHRFIVLIDVLYEAHTHVIFLAAAAPDDLFDYSGSVLSASSLRGIDYAQAAQIDRNAPGNSLQTVAVQESAFGVGRLRSRLVEMQSESYWTKKPIK